MRRTPRFTSGVGPRRLAFDHARILFDEVLDRIDLTPIQPEFQMRT
jgi:hypothetical protein